jgi:sulfur carrier protein ThiS adenylyltransferase
MGLRNISLWDHDSVDEGNLGTQGWWEEDIGDKKVRALGSTMRALSSEVSVMEYPSVWGPQEGPRPVFCCVDTMAARRRIGDTHRGPIFDGRMLGENLRVVCRGEGPTERYLGTLLSDEEASEGRCTSRSTIYAANILAGLLIFEYIDWVRGGSLGGMFRDYMYVLPVRQVDHMGDTGR